MYFVTEDGGRTWTKNPIGYKGYLQRFFVFGDTTILVLRCCYGDSNFSNDTTYIVESTNKGEDFHLLYRTPDFIQDIRFSTSATGQILLRKDDSSYNLYELITYAHGSTAPVCFFYNDHYYVAILSDTTVGAFTSEEAFGIDVNRWSVINTKTDTRQSYQLNDVYSIENTEIVVQHGVLFLPVYQTGKQKARLLCAASDMIKYIDLGTLSHYQPEKIIVQNSTICVGAYDNMATRHTLLISKDKGANWVENRTCDLPLHIAASCLLSDTLYVCDIDSIRRIPLH